MSDFGISSSEFYARQAEGAALDDRIEKWERHSEPVSYKPKPADLASLKFPRHVAFMAPAREGYVESGVTHFFNQYADAAVAASAWCDFWTSVTGDLYEPAAQIAVSGRAEVILNPLFGA